MSRLSNITRSILANAVSLHKWALLLKLAKAKQELEVQRSAHKALLRAAVESSDRVHDAGIEFDKLARETNAELADL